MTDAPASRDALLARLVAAMERLAPPPPPAPDFAAARLFHYDPVNRAFLPAPDYGLALDLLEPGGTLVQCSCTSRVSSDALVEVVRTTAAAKGVQLRSVTTTGHALDHPVSFPEGEYLSAVFARVDR